MRTIVTAMMRRHPLTTPRKLTASELSDMGGSGKEKAVPRVLLGVPLIVEGLYTHRTLFR